jgi:competence protein ComEC
VACALVLWPPRAARNDLRITFIDVGQADAILIQTPRGHAIMIDTGGRLEQNESGDGASAAESVGEKVVVPFLVRQGIHHVDAILLTHPHGDHQAVDVHKCRAREKVSKRNAKRCCVNARTSLLLPVR